MGYEGAKLAAFCQQQPSQVTARRMCEHGSERILKLVVQNTPIDDSPEPSRPPGTARRSWRRKPVRRGASILSEQVWEGGVETDDEVAGFLETGTGLYGPHHQAYWIRPKKPGGTLRFWSRRDGNWVFAKEVLHPGIRPQRPLAIAMAVTEHELDRVLASDLDAWRRMWESMVALSATRRVG